MPRHQNKLTILVVLVILLSACSGRSATTPALATPTPLQGITSHPEADVNITPSPVPSPTSLPYLPAASVGTKVIYQPEVTTARGQLEAALQQFGITLPPEQQDALILQDLIDQELLAQAAFENGFTLTEQDVRAAYDRLNSSVPGGMEAWLSRSGYTYDFFLVALHRSLAAAWMRDQITASVETEAEQVRARQVVASTLEEAHQVLDRVRQSGADFRTIAYQYDPYTGGDLGWFSRGMLFFPQVEEAAFALTSTAGGEPVFSEPVESPLGFHVLQVIGRETRPLATAARLALQQQALEDWLASRRTALQMESPASSAPDQAVQATDHVPVYPVQEGENYYVIAQRLRVPVQALIDANPNFPPEALSTGSELVIPGVSGAEGRIFAIDKPPAVSLPALAYAYGVDVSLLARLNHLTSPAQLYEGAALLLPEALSTRAGAPPVAAAPLLTGGTLLEAAVQAGETPWAVALASGVYTPGSTLPGQTLFLPPREGRDPRSVPVDLTALQLVQGSTLAIFVQRPDLETPPTGTLNGLPLHFFRVSDGWTALQGMPAMGEPGLALMELQTADLGSFEMSLPFYPGDFPQDPPLTVDPATIDPAVTAPEEARVAEITAPATAEKLWDGPFLPPVDSPGCFRSLFGNRRSFNGSPYIYYHAGLDYGVCASLDIYAPAPGKVVFAGPLDVRGNATIVDHGWGVYSGFWHQSEILVSVGDTIQTGQVIGKIGATGRITGEHLHWEIWAGGVQVNPMEWLETTFP